MLNTGESFWNRTYVLGLTVFEERRMQLIFGTKSKLQADSL